MELLGSVDAVMNHFLSLAFEQAKINLGSTKTNPSVGCVLVKDTRVVSVGYNGFLAKTPHKSIVKNNHEQATVHAEQNAISDCAKRGVSCLECTAYITHYPCYNCMKLMVSCGICEIKYINDLPNEYNVLRIQTEVDKDYKGPIRIMHWTGQKGKKIIHNKKWD